LPDAPFQTIVSFFMAKDAPKTFLLSTVLSKIVWKELSVTILLLLFSTCPNTILEPANANVIKNNFNCLIR
jgi:hypothetical protein